ncbi:hypothetical protein U9M48_007601, partial [Paspalum notatum var. saurae]
MPPPAPPSPPPHVTSPPRPLAAFLASQVRRRRHSTAGLGRADGDSRWSSREGATAEVSAGGEFLQCVVAELIIFVLSNFAAGRKKIISLPSKHVPVTFLSACFKGLCCFVAVVATAVVGGLD